MGAGEEYHSIGEVRSRLAQKLLPPILAPVRASVSLIGSILLFVGVLLSGFVISEPAPYELFMVTLVALWGALIRISKTVSLLIALLLAFNVGGLLSLTTMPDLSAGPMYIAVSVFLALTAIFFAAVIEEKQSRLALIFRAWTTGALITAILGIAGYFQLFPGAEIFTLYDRAKGAFQDPNVFGPFLVTPSLYLVSKLLTGDKRQAPFYICGIMLLAMGVFLSFSRAAWGLFIFSMAMLVLLMMLKETSAVFRFRVVMISAGTAIVLIFGLIAALQSEQISQLLSSRTQLVQEYDGGRMGRFERHRIGFLLAMERPLGIGPMRFGKIYGEDEHNIWLKSLMAYGWLGFGTYFSLVMCTLAFGLRTLLRNRPWQPYLLVSYIAFAGHTLIGFVIDTDHWRHVYLLIGILWGCFALERRHGAGFIFPGARNQTGFEPRQP